MPLLSEPKGGKMLERGGVVASDLVSADLPTLPHYGNRKITIQTSQVDVYTYTVWVLKTSMHSFRSPDLILNSFWL